MVNFAMMHVISALFIRETLAAAENNKEIQMELQAQKRAKNTLKLKELFELIDESGDGLICEVEMQNLIHNPGAMRVLTDLHLTAEDLMHLFTLLDDGKGSIGFAEFT